MRTPGMVLLVVLGACEAETPPPAPPAKVIAAPAATAATALPPPPRYVGRWAARADACATGWWRFWNDEVLTAGETRCDILPPDAKSGDTRLRTVCQAEGKVTREDWAITYPADDQMTVVRDDAAPVTLTRC